ncbi:MAG: NADH-quinone oxidoreductase subunit D, partial [Candidatus Hydrothermota bacterium]
MNGTRNQVREFEYFIGPQHPGISGNYSIKLKAVGDEIIEAEARPGYLHRGFEKLMEQRHWIKNVPMVCRICVPDPDPNEVLYSMGVEEIAGLEVPERAQWIRVMVLEMSRIQAHLFFLGGFCGSLGLYTVPQWTFGDRDYILDRFEELTGARVYHLYTMPGGVRRDLPPGFKDRLLETLAYIEKRLHDYDRLIFDNPVFQKRTIGVGVIKADWAMENGVTGPNLRATGVKFDLRRDDPYLVYDQIDFEIPTMPDGDMFSRAMVRRLEIEQSIKIIRQVLEMMPEGPVLNRPGNPLTWRVPP